MFVQPQSKLFDGVIILRSCHADFMLFLAENVGEMCEFGQNKRALSYTF